MLLVCFVKQKGETKKAKPSSRNYLSGKRKVKRRTKWLKTVKRAYVKRMRLKFPPLPQSRNPHAFFEPENFEEKAYYTILMKSLVAVGAIAIGLVLFFSYTLIPESLGQAKLITLLVLLFSMVALWLFFDMRFGVKDGKIFAKTGPFSFKIDRDSVERVEILERIPVWAGWGLRVWWYRGGLALAFVSSHKPSLLLRKKTGLFKQIVLTVEDPHYFARRAGLKFIK